MLKAVLAAFLSQAAAAASMQVSDPAIIIDGDNLWVGGQEIRIFGIDAPETSQRCQLPKGTWDCSEAVIAALHAATDGKTVQCEGQEFDQYGRLIARCATDEVPDIGAQLVASGLAWAFVKCSTDYVSLEQDPRAKKLGIWQSKTQPPW
jgi:endonuclease YncB( thermonuclease family)